MIEIHPLREKQVLEKLYSQNNVLMNENSIAVVATDNTEVLGFCLFDLGDSTVVHCINPENDIAFADGLLRSALHVGVENGKMTAFYSETAPVALLETLKFIKNADNRELNVDKLFSSCQNC